MESNIAIAATDAIVQSGHPRVDYRTEEAKGYTLWMDEHLTPYIFQGCELLDIGCAAGKGTFKAEELGAKVTGVDCSPQAIQLAKEIAKDIGSSATFVEGDYNKMPFDGDSFDIALFPKNIVECGYTEISMLAGQLKRILRPDGLFIMTMRDALETLFYGNSKNSVNYERLTGRFQNTITVPASGTFEYPTQFWTVAFAVYVIGQHLTFENSVEMDKSDSLLVFRRT